MKYFIFIISVLLLGVQLNAQTPKPVPAPVKIKHPKSDWSGFIGQVKSGVATSSKIKMSKSQLLEECVKRGNSSDLNTLTRKGMVNPKQVVNGRTRLSREIASGSPSTKVVEMLSPYYSQAELTTLSLRAINQGNHAASLKMAKKANHTTVLKHTAQKGKSNLFCDLVRSGLVSRDNAILSIAVSNQNSTIVKAAIDDLSIPAMPGFQQAHNSGSDQMMLAIIQTRKFSKTEGAQYVIQQRTNRMLGQMITRSNVHTLVHTSISADNEPAIRMTVDRGGNPDLPIPYAIDRRNINLLRFLIVEQRGNADRALSYAWDNRHLRLIGDDMDLTLRAGASPQGYVLKAALDGKKAHLEMFLDHGGDPDEAVPEMVDRRNYPTLEFLFSRGGDARPSTYMRDAGHTGDIQLGEILVRYGGDPYPAAEPAIDASHDAMVRWLIRQRVDLKSASFLCIAIGNEDGTMVELLVYEAKSSPQQGIGCSIKKCSMDMINLLLSAGAQLNQSEYLVIAAKKGCSTQIIDKILAQGFDPQIGMKPAVSEGHLPVVKHLASKGADPTEALLLEQAARRNRVEIANFLMEKGADPNGAGAISIAVDLSHDRMLTTLIDHGGTATDPYLMINAVDNLDAGIIDILCANKANARPIDYLRKGLQHSATAVVGVLLKYGADATPREHLEQAILSRDHAPTAELLVQHGADASDGEFLFAGVESSNVEMVKLLDEISDLCYTNQNRVSHLHMAVETRNSKILSLLAEAGAPANKLDAHNHTPLEMVVTYKPDKKNGKNKEKRSTWRDKNLELTHILVEKANANPGIRVKNEKGKLKPLFKEARTQKVKNYLKKQSKIYRVDKDREQLCKPAQEHLGFK